jgi:hypothetical protein
MTYPVGGLPTRIQAESFSNIDCPTKSVAFTHAGSDLDLTDPANGCTPCATSLYALGTGNLICRLSGDTSERTYPVVAGTQINGAFVLIKSTSTADCIARC